MEREYLTYGLRARAAQLLTWLMGPAQNQQRQSMENDRQTHDGITRGSDDPDNRARQQAIGPRPWARHRRGLRRHRRHPGMCSMGMMAQTMSASRENSDPSPDKAPLTSPWPLNGPSRRPSRTPRC